MDINFEVISNKIPCSKKDFFVDIKNNLVIRIIFLFIIPIIIGKISL